MISNQITSNATFDVNIEIQHISVIDDKEYDVVIYYKNSATNALIPIDTYNVGKPYKTRINGKEHVKIKIPIEYQLRHNQGKLYYVLL